MRKSNIIWILALMSIFLLTVVTAVMSVKIHEYNEKLMSMETSNSSIVQLGEKSDTDKTCPDASGGLNESYLRVKYFYSEYCPWCRKEEPILQRLVETSGNLISIEWYDVNRCPELAAEYKVGGVPTFVFSTLNNGTEYSHYGFIYEKDLVKLMCDVTGGC